MTLSEDLADWCDWDDAARAYGLALGLFDGATGRQVTRLLLSNNTLGNGLYAGMAALVAAGVVERRTEPVEQFRWSFAGVGAHLPEPDLEQAEGDASTPPGPPRPAPYSATPVTAARRWWKRG